ncbi:hypothetical protein QN277_016544 [Acacia crassicarpa]|uniref:Uncharacterized protein n=1 Tax=Acacia crassicarpa TaxID=499986 RepID=A0AAE1MWW0_9FABA|nr:hypothetical protein QN277_016544 [Acacia crassicarpa]
MSKPWGGVGAWAAEAEEREAVASAVASESQNFPSLKEAVNTKPKKKKITLSEFNSISTADGGGVTTDYTRLTPEEMLWLPTGPKERSADEMPYSRGFSSYGGRSGPLQEHMRDRNDNDGSWGGGRRSYGGFSSGFRNLGVEPDRWTRGPPRDNEREHPRLMLNPPKGNAPVNEPVKTNRASPFGAARPREEVLAEKGVDWKKVDSEIEAKKTSRPSSSHSMRPSSAQSSRSEDTGLQEGEILVKPVFPPR